MCIRDRGNLRTNLGFDEIIAVYKENELYRPTIIEALGKIRTQESIDFINQNYYGSDDLTKYSLIESLGNVGNKDSFTMLINDIKYLKGAFKWVAIETIGKLQEKLDLNLPEDIDLKNSLLETLESADIQYKKAAVRLVCLFKDDELLEKVFGIYGNDEIIDEKLKDYFAQNLLLFFKKVSVYLKQHPANLKSILQLIVEMVQIDGGECLTKVNELEFRSFIEQFSEHLTNSDEEVRAIALELLYFLDAETALMFSDTMLEDTVSWNRLRLLEIIQNGDNPKIIDIIKVLAYDENEMIRENAINVLNERGISNLVLRDQ